MSHGAIEFQMLGPLEAWVGGEPVALGGPKQRALVALLLLHANDVVPLDVLIEELWAGTPPPSARESVQNCVSRLRKAFSPAETLETRPPGYRLLIEPDAIDARRFERLVREAREKPARERADALREALQLWQGTPLSDLAYWGFAQDPIRLLEERRINALQMRLEAELELGLHRESVGELDALAREFPTHERLRWLQMLALHRSDRRLDALAAYQEVRLAIVEESGMEPGEELRALQRRILQDDPTLMPGGGVGAEEIVERAPHLTRKVVAVCIVELLVDEKMDVEASRGVVSRGLASLEEIVLRHGGTVEQLLGEEALAVFGLPAAHEDDVLRALRTAMELREALSGVEMRAAVETGEVLVGEDGRILAGGALTTARREKESTPAGTIHLGPVAAAQSSGAAWSEASNGSHRLLELVEGAPAVARRPDAPLVGRQSELERLVLAVRESAASSTCRRVVVLGEPGIGKTRLAAELARAVENEARVLHGRCVPYADGATYLPLADVVRQIAGGEELGPALKDVLAEETDGEQAAMRLVDTLSGSGAVDSGDVFWAARKLLEALARTQPVVVVLEDVHWAEPTFLDLIEYVAGWSTGAPIMLVCLARTELLDARPAWTADTIPLRPLSDHETADLLDAMPEALAIDADGRAAVVSAAEGNPLFLEQLAAHALDGPFGPGHVPASLESLLASRLDALQPAERAVLEHAAIIGREFTRAAVDALLPDESPGSASPLLALVRRRLVRADPESRGEDAFLFDHALIRDATYGAIAKAERARLHEHLARWLDERGELDEIVGYHLEQAVLNRREAGEDASGLADEAAERLGEAGERAVWNRDHRASVSLLMRASQLLDATSARRIELECLMSIALKNLWERRRALELIDDLGRRAAAIGDRRLELRAWVEQIWPRFNEVSDPEAVVATLEEAIRACGVDDDVLGLARAWHTLAATESLLRGRFDVAAEAARRSADYYARCGAVGILDSLVVGCMADGSGRLADAEEYGESRLRVADLARAAEAMLSSDLAVLKALVGELDRSRGLLERARRRLLEIGDDIAIATRWSLCVTSVELLGRDARAAEAIAMPALTAAKTHDDRSWQARFLCVLAEVAVLDGDFERVLTVADEARDLATERDLFHAMGWRCPRARALAALGQPDLAEKLARETMTIVDATDYLVGRGEVRLVLADVLAARAKSDEATRVAEEAAALFEAKGAKLLADRARARVTALRGGEPGGRAPLQRA